METRLVRDELAKCWRTEGVNHYETCHHLTAKYLDMLRENRVCLPYPLVFHRDSLPYDGIADQVACAFQIEGFRKLDFTP